MFIVPAQHCPLFLKTKISTLPMPPPSASSTQLEKSTYHFPWWRQVNQKIFPACCLNLSRTALGYYVLGWKPPGKALF